MKVRKIRKHILLNKDVLIIFSLFLRNTNQNKEYAMACAFNQHNCIAKTFFNNHIYEYMIKKIRIQGTPQIFLSKISLTFFILSTSVKYFTHYKVLDLK